MGQEQSHGVDNGTRRCAAPPSERHRSRAAAFLQFIGDALAAWRSWQEREATIRDLRAWDDRMLKDIGLTRGEIIAAVDGRLERGRCRRPEPK